MPTLTAVRDERTAKSRELEDIFRKYADTGDMTPDDQAAVKVLSDAIANLVTEYERIDGLERLRAGNAEWLRADATVEKRPFFGTPSRNGDGHGHGGEPETFGALLKGLGPLENGSRFAVTGKAAADLLTGWRLSMEAKAAITTVDISSTQRLAGIMAPLAPPLMVADLPSTLTTTATTIEYYAETTTTNNAAAVTQATAKPESILDFTLIQQPIPTIATWVQATKQVLMDVAGIEAYFRERLGFFVRQELDDQLLNGNGTPPNMRGYLATVGIQTEATGAGGVLVAVYNAITKIRNAGAEPTAIVMNPTDWGSLRMSANTSGDFYFGNPSLAGVERVFGIPVVVTSVIAQGTALVGAFRPHSVLWMREGVDIRISDSHADFFILNILAIRAELRAALAVYRPTAFCTVTAIPAPV